MRRWATVGAIGAAIVTIVFATLGDGVDSAGTGATRWVIDHGHTLTWALLTATLALVAIGRGPRWLVNLCAWSALAMYVLFLVAVFRT